MRLKGTVQECGPGWVGNASIVPRLSWERLLCLCQQCAPGAHCAWAYLSLPLMVDPVARDTETSKCSNSVVYSCKAHRHTFSSQPLSNFQFSLLLGIALVCGQLVYVWFQLVINGPVNLTWDLFMLSSLQRVTILYNMPFPPVVLMDLLQASLPWSIATKKPGKALLFHLAHQIFVLHRKSADEPVVPSTDAQGAPRWC